VLLKGHIPGAFGFFIMHTPRLIVAALGALAWLAPVTDAADDLQAQVEQLPQKLNLLIGKSHSKLLILQQERVGPNAQMPLNRTNNMSASSPAQALPSISLTTSVDGKSVHQGDTITITWQSINPPSGAAVALFSQKAVTGRVFDPMTTAQPASGSYTWQVPIYVSLPIPCAPDITGGCVGSMNPGTIYKIVARLYTPSDADFLEYGPSKTHPTYIAAAESDEFAMLSAR
jgi:hypothetical protein